MPLPRIVVRFNGHVTNRIAMKLAGRLPGFGILHHTGRVSGHPYRTPVNIFRSGERYIIALTYGAESDWVKNVLAASRCEVRSRGAG
ncbi:MAG: nitroreductase family deazaflavin-dependent oxidoreductase [Chloroflexota bacterium]